MIRCIDCENYIKDEMNEKRNNCKVKGWTWSSFEEWECDKFEPTSKLKFPTIFKLKDLHGKDLKMGYFENGTNYILVGTDNKGVIHVIAEGNK